MLIMRDGEGKIPTAGNMFYNRDDNVLLIFFLKKTRDGADLFA